MCESMRRTFHPQESTQMGSEPMFGPQVLDKSKSSSKRAFREHVADQQTKEVGAQYAQEQRDIAGEQVTTEFLKELRAYYASGKRGDQHWSTVTRQSTNNPEESIY